MAKAAGNSDSLDLRQARLPSTLHNVPYIPIDVVMEKIVQREQETPTSNGRQIIDDFSLRGSRTWRHMGGHLSKEG